MLDWTGRDLGLVRPDILAPVVVHSEPVCLVISPFTLISPLRHRDSP